ncbi:amino acid ABC transporter permease [Azospirillum sp. YIM B02556]|uniref:Amino acid ABC transporter permease n=1 Tax=Azospirillum endophyticum TaxID=2800326 RepID=A0ABS1FHN7_9PROT|nr:amino acid ABC transporter permease [Azospirillum endophyticum]MBK1842938.1 amino acid ABC transporter permease [Azospirillum endophyticum]
MQAIDFTIVLQAWPYLCSGLAFSLALTATAFTAGILLGTGLALAQHLEIPVLGHAARIYIATMRSIPLILVLFWFFFLAPVILGSLSPDGRPVSIGPTSTAFITFCLFEAAYYSEIIRVGLRALSRGQVEASQSLGLTTPQTYRYVVLPQVARTVAPIVLSQTIILFQDTSLVYVLSLTDLVGATSKLVQLNGRFVELYVTVALVYLTICSLASHCVAILKRRTAGHAAQR